MTSKVEEFAKTLAEAESTLVGILPLTSIDSELTVKAARKYKEKGRTRSENRREKDWLNFPGHAESIRC